VTVRRERRAAARRRRTALRRGPGLRTAAAASLLAAGIWAGAGILTDPTGLPDAVVPAAWVPARKAPDPPAELLAAGLRPPAALPVRPTEASPIETKRSPAARPERLLAPPELPHLVADLADDHVRWNAGKAMRRLARIGAPAVPALQTALDSPDHQQRQLAATVLRRLVETPSDRLLEVTVEGLRYDRLPWGDGRFTPAAHNEREGTVYLLAHARRVWPALIMGLDSQDGQERFLCAFLLGRSHCPTAVPRTCEILIEHLRDNRISGDALMSVNALYGLGRLALPFLVLAEPGADRQARQLLELLQLDIARPPRDARELAERRRMQRVTRVYADPAIELDLRRSGSIAWGDAMSRSVGR